MTTNYIAARDSIFNVLKTAISSFSPYIPKVEYPMLVHKNKPDPSKIWMRASTQIVEEIQTALSTCEQVDGQKLYTSYGLIFIEMYIPRTEPNGTLALMWATSIRNAYRNASSQNGVIYRKARINDGITPEENFFRVNVVVDFEFDEIK